MGAVDLARDRSRPPRHEKRRLGIRIDMTPMVDVAFLLLIFFMVTTIFRTPRALEMNLPTTQTPVAKKDIFYIKVLAGDRMFWNLGDAEPSRVTLAQLSPLIRSRHASNPRLVVVIEVDRTAAFHNMVDVIDELDLARVTRFSTAPLTEEEREEIEAL